jgi:hypothetical protein
MFHPLLTCESCPNKGDSIRYDLLSTNSGFEEREREYQDSGSLNLAILEHMPRGYEPG